MTIQQMKIDELKEHNKYLALCITEQENIINKHKKDIEHFLSEMKLNKSLIQKYENEKRLEDNF